MTGRVYIPQHIYLRGMRKAGKGKNDAALDSAPDSAPDLPPRAHSVGPRAGDEGELPQSVVVRIKLVTCYLCLACVE